MFFTITIQQQHSTEHRQQSKFNTQPMYRFSYKFQTYPCPLFPGLQLRSENICYRKLQPAVESDCGQVIKFRTHHEDEERSKEGERETEWVQIQGGEVGANPS